MLKKLFEKTKEFSSKNTKKKNNYKKLMLFIVIFLISLSMIPWVISDYQFNNVDDRKWIKVGKKYTDANIIMGEYNAFIQNNYHQLQQNPYMLFSVLNNIISNHISTLIFANEAERLNLVVSDESLIKVISQIPSFQKEDGSFNQEAFVKQLQNIFGSEEVFLNNVKNELLKEQVLGTLALANTSPYFVGYLEYLFLMQKREIKYIDINPSLIKETLPVATDKNLQKVLTENESSFLIPRKTTGDILTYDINNLEKRIKVSNQEVRDFYEKNKNNYLLGERRTIRQINFSSKEEAQEAYDSLQSIPSNELDNHYRIIYLTEIEQEDIDENLAKKVFKAKVNELSSPLETIFGWHIFIVDEIIAPSAMELSTVYEEIKDEIFINKYQLSLDNIRSEILNLSNQEISLEDLAKRIGASFKSFTEVTAQNVDNISSDLGIKEAILSLNTNESSGIIELENGNLSFVKINKVQEQRLPAINEVKKDLQAIWQKQKQNEKLQEIAANIILEISSGKDISSLNYRVRTATADFLDVNQNFTQETLEQAFLVDKGKAFQSILSNGNTMIGVITNITNSQKSLYDKDKSLNQEILNFIYRINNQYSQGYLQQYGENVQKRYKVDVNQEAIMNNLAPSE